MPTNPKDPPPEIAVLIVTYNSARDITACLRSIPKYFESIPYEVCVIDNASQDSSAVIVQHNFPEVTLIQGSKNKGFAAAINRGIKRTRAPYLFWMNPDSQIAEGSFSPLLNYLKEHSSVGILGVKIINPDKSLQLSARAFPSYATAFFNRYSLMSRLFPNNPFTRSYLGKDRDYTEIHSIDWVSGAGLLHRRELTQEIGFLDEKFFMYCEDVDFCFRAHQGGWTTAYHPGLTLCHTIGGSSKSIPIRMILARHQSIWRYYKKHFKKNLFAGFFVALGILMRGSILLIFAVIKEIIHAKH